MLSNLFRTAFLFLPFLISSCSNDSSNGEKDINSGNGDSTTSLFPLLFDSTNFISSNGHVAFGGDLVFTNMSGYKLSDILKKNATLEINYPDNQTVSYNMMLIIDNPKEKWPDKSYIKFDIAIDPFKEERPFLTNDDFNRTPESVHLYISMTAINVDKEMPFAYQADLLSNWKKFQTKIGLR